MSTTAVEEQIRLISTDIIRHFLHDKHQSAFQRIPEVLGELGKYTEMIIQRSELSIEQTIQALNDILVVLSEAIGAKDSVLICDILEYEMMPFLARNQTSVLDDKSRGRKNGPL